MSIMPSSGVRCVPTWRWAMGAGSRREATTPSARRDFALQRLPGFKVPTRILILAEIPTTPTGKVQRVGLADRLAPEFAVTYERPAKGLEQLSAVVFGHTATLPPLFEFPTLPMGAMDLCFHSSSNLPRLKSRVRIPFPALILNNCPKQATEASR